jgi:hypothetical protein
MYRQNRSQNQGQSCIYFVAQNTIKNHLHNSFFYEKKECTDIIGYLYDTGVASTGTRDDTGTGTLIHHAKKSIGSGTCTGTFVLYTGSSTYLLIKLKREWGRFTFTGQQGILRKNVE